MNPEDWVEDPVASFDAFAVPEVNPRALKKAVKRRLRFKSSAPPVIPDDPLEKLKAATRAYRKLSVKQRAYLGAYQEAGLNKGRAIRALEGTEHQVERSTVTRWRQNNRDFKLAISVVEGEALKDVMAPERLLLRQDDIVETLLTPKPVLHQGRATGHMEVEAGAASRANEVMLRAAGVLKEKDQASMTFTGPSFHISVVQRDMSVIDVTPRGVEVMLPAPVPQLTETAADEDWLGS